MKGKPRCGVQPWTSYDRQLEQEDVERLTTVLEKANFLGARNGP